MATDPLYYFLSFPKTASTTLYYILVQQFGQDRVSPRQGLPEFIRSIDEMQDKYTVIAGHYFYNLRQVLNREPIYLTMVREPISRTISNYNFIRRNRPDSYEATHSLDDFISNPSNYWKFSNLQTRYFGLHRNIVRAKANLLSGVYDDREVVENLTKYAPLGFHDAQMLGVAEERLFRMGFVGVKERFRESVILLHKTFNWQLPLSYDSWEVDPNPILTVPTKTEQKIADQCELDIELYEFCLELFTDRYEEIREQ